MHSLSKKGPASSRSETVAVRLDPKVRYLVELAARDQQRSLSSFVEAIIRKALIAGDFNEEPNYGTDISRPAAPPPMWGEGFWDIDPADRFFLLATARHDLLTVDEARLWKLLSGSITDNGERLNIRRFRVAYNDPSIHTAHVEMGGEA
ncbi:MAG: hypothetical protein V4555_04310 [Acidobacteriota bacterium]